MAQCGWCWNFASTTTSSTPCIYCGRIVPWEKRGPRHVVDINDVEAEDAGGGGGGSLTVKDEGSNLDTAVTSIDYTGAGVSASAVGHAVTVAVTGGGAITVSEADPGAIGAKKLWLQVLDADGNGDGGTGQLWVRNSTNDGWNSAGPLTYSDAFRTILEGPDESASITLKNTGQVSSWFADIIELHGYNNVLRIDADGVALGSGGPLLVPGSADPTAGAGVVAQVGSVYLRSDGTFWTKTGAGDTAWTRLVAVGEVTGFTDTSLASYTAAGAISLTATAANATLSGDGVTVDAGGNPLDLSGSELKFNDLPIGTQAAFVEPTTATPEDICNALIATGLMAAS